MAIHPEGPANPTRTLQGIQGSAALLHNPCPDANPTIPTPLAPCRGYKVVLRFFPNDVANFEPVVGLLGWLTQKVRPAQTLLCVCNTCMQVTMCLFCDRSS